MKQLEFEKSSEDAYEPSYYPRGVEIKLLSLPHFMRYEQILEIAIFGHDIWILK